MQEILRNKLNLEAQSIRGLKSNTATAELKIVAEGDSWFAYPLVLDVIDQLRRMGYFIHRDSVPGDTLENMVYGSEYKLVKRLKGVINHGPRDLQETMTSIRKYKPRIVLFSGGGNDIVGKDIAQYLFHKTLTNNVFRKDLFHENIEKFMKPAIQRFCDFVWQIDDSIDILMDGYDYPVPNGKSYFGVSGPWLLPTFGAKAITERKEQEEILKQLIDGFNEAQIELENLNPHFHHVDLRGMFPEDKEWHNEIHLKAKGYKKVARKYHEKISAVLGSDPLKK